MHDPEFRVKKHCDPIFVIYRNPYQTYEGITGFGCRKTDCKMDVLRTQVKLSSTGRPIFSHNKLSDEPPFQTINLLEVLISQESCFVVSQGKTWKNDGVRQITNLDTLQMVVLPTHIDFSVGHFDSWIIDAECRFLIAPLNNHHHGSVVISLNTGAIVFAIYARKLSGLHWDTKLPQSIWWPNQLF